MKINTIIINYIQENKLKTIFWILITLILYPLDKVIIPKYYGFVINSFKDKKNFNVNVLYLASFYLLSMFIGVIGVYSSKLITPTFGEYITTKFYNFIIDNYHLQFDNIETGAIISKLIGLPYLFFNYVEIMRTIVFSQIFIFITALYHYWFVSYKIFYYFVICLIINFIFIYYLYKKKYEVDIELHNSKAILYQYINDVYTNLVSIYGFNQEEYEKEQFKEVEYKKYDRFLVKTLNIYFISSILWNIICAFVFFGLNYLLYKAYKDKEISIEVLVSTFTMTFSILGVFENTVNVSNQISKLFSEIGDIETYFEDIKEKNKNKNKPSNKFKNGDIVFKNVYYKYNDNLVLNNINITIKRGEHVVIVGPIGSGKSTIIKLLMGYNRLLMGTITINNIKIDRLYSNELRENIYYIPQKPKLFNRTLYKNITYGLSNPPKKENILKLLEQLNLTDLIEPFTKKMNENVGVDGNNLSGGQKQIVWLLRAFYRDKNIIILDEPTASLDKENKNLLIKNIKRLCLGKTLIIISHDTISQDFRKIHIKDGKNVKQLW